MRTLIKLFLVLTLALSAVSSLALAGDKPWFDLENCGMCKVMTEYDGLMDNMSWEHLNVSNGVMTVSTVKDAYLDSYRKAQKQMMEHGKMLEKGEKMELCGMCTALGKIFAKGIKQEYIVTQHGDIWLLTSDKPELVKELQDWATHTNKEMEMMMASYESMPEKSK